MRLLLDQRDPLPRRLPASGGDHQPRLLRAAGGRGGVAGDGRRAGALRAQGFLLGRAGRGRALAARSIPAGAARASAFSFSYARMIPGISRAATTLRGELERAVRRSRSAVSEESCLSVSARQARAKPQEEPRAPRTVGGARFEFRLGPRSPGSVAFLEAGARTRSQARAHLEAFARICPARTGVLLVPARVFRRPAVRGRRTPLRSARRRSPRPTIPKT